MNKRVIYKDPETGVLCVVQPVEASLEDVLASKSLEAFDLTVVDVSEIPTDRTFREAWDCREGKLHVSLTRSKEIAHNKRREVRAKRMAPLDVEVTIPGKAVKAENARAQLRSLYGRVQTDIDAATDITTLEVIMDHSDMKDVHR